MEGPYVLKKVSATWRRFCQTIAKKNYVHNDILQCD